jgi:hypothetical protein
VTRQFPHRCDDRCTCPVHGTPLLYWPAGDDHACQDSTCEFAHGTDDALLKAAGWVMAKVADDIRAAQPKVAEAVRAALADMDRVQERVFPRSRPVTDGG